MALVVVDVLQLVPTLLEAVEQAGQRPHGHDQRDPLSAGRVTSGCVNSPLLLPGPGVHPDGTSALTRIAAAVARDLAEVRPAPRERARRSA